MQDFPVELIIEILVAVLLLATIFYSHILNRRLRTLREGQDGLRELIESLNVATERARNAIAEMKSTSETSAAGLQDQIGKARSLTDELALMIESGNNLAGRIETRLTGGTSVRGTSSPSASGGGSPMMAQEVSHPQETAPHQPNLGQASPNAADDPDQAKKDLLAALRQTR